MILWCKICSKLTRKKTLNEVIDVVGVFFVNFEHISSFFLVFLQSILCMHLLAGINHQQSLSNYYHIFTNSFFHFSNKKCQNMVNMLFSFNISMHMTVFVSSMSNISQHHKATRIASSFLRIVLGFRQNTYRELSATLQISTNTV